MGEGEKRRTRRTARYDSRELALLSKKLTPSEAEWDAKIASGTLNADSPLVQRTVTVDDPFTTSLLAEVARRSMTVEVLPEQIDEATDIEPGEIDPTGDPTDHPK